MGETKEPLTANAPLKCGDEVDFGNRVVLSEEVGLNGLVSLH